MRKSWLFFLTHTHQNLTDEQSLGPGQVWCLGVPLPWQLHRNTGVIPNIALNKAVPHGFEKSCSAMATQKLEEKVQAHDEDAECSKTGCRTPSRARSSKTPRLWGCARRTQELTVHAHRITGTPLFGPYGTPPSRLLRFYFVFYCH